MPWTNSEQRLLSARNGYAYPFVYIDSFSQDPAGRFVPIPAAQPFAYLDDWETLHTKRLNSSQSADAMLGVASIAYWGFYAGAASSSRTTSARALVRSTWAANGRKTARAPHPGPSAVLAALQTAAGHLAAGDVALSIRSIATLPEFGQLSFASKVLAAMSPQQCGVYDKVVGEGLLAGGWHHLTVAANQGGVSTPKAEVYARWCRQLSARAAEMNSFGPGAGWDYDHAHKRAWRAVDVERAFFRDKDVRLLGAIVA